MERDMNHKRLSTTYQVIIDDTGFIVEVSNNGRLTICNGGELDKDFTFHNSDPKIVRRIANLLNYAADLVERTEDEMEEAKYQKCKEKMEEGIERIEKDLDNRIK